MHEWWPGNQFEVCVGAVLTQNTNWKNVERALKNLKQAEANSFAKLNKMDINELEALIRPAGFYKQKAGYLKNLAILVIGFPSFNAFLKNVTREQLLSVNGIGRETADSILLYACNKLHFVVDAYTKRLLAEYNILNGNESYDEIKTMFESLLRKDILVYKRMHGLIVEYGKNRNKSFAPIV